MNKKEISVQLYTTRKFKPYAPIFEFIKESGVKNIELFGLESVNIKEFKHMMRSNNITSHSTRRTVSCTLSEKRVPLFC